MIPVQLFTYMSTQLYLLSSQNPTHPPYFQICVLYIYKKTELKYVFDKSMGGCVVAAAQSSLCSSLGAATLTKT